MDDGEGDGIDVCVAYYYHSISYVGLSEDVIIEIYAEDNDKMDYTGG